MAAPIYPLSLPSTPAFNRSRWVLERKVGMSESPFTGQQQVYEHNFALWTATMTLPPMKREQASAWLAFFLKLHGKRGTFLMGDPDASSSQGNISGAVTLTDGIAVGDFTISLTTTLTSTADVFKAGDYIQIGTGASAKLYMIVDDADSDASGLVDVNVEPKIKATAAANASVIYSGAKGLFRMDTDELGWDSDHVSKYGITFSCTEAA